MRPAIGLKSTQPNMDRYSLPLLLCALVCVSAWSRPFYPVHRLPGAVRVTRFAPPPHSPPRHHRVPQPVRQEEPKWHRPKRDYEHDDHDDHRGTSGVTGPVHTFVKTDKNANYKWGVRHHVGNKYAS